MNNQQNASVRSASSRLVVIVPQFSHWHGARVMKAEDYHCAADELPPERAVKDLGRKYLINPDTLRMFVTLRKQVFNTLAGAGVRFLSGYAVPEDEAPAVMAELDDCCERFERAKQQFLARYGENVEKWAADNPSFAAEIRAGKLSDQEVAGRFQSGYSAVKLAPLPGKEADLEKSVGSLMDPLLEEAAKAAKDAYKAFVEGHSDCSLYLKRRLVRIVDKLRSLSFVLHDDARLDQADAASTYGLVDGMPAMDLQAYRTAMGALHEAICRCHHALPGTQGFLQQSMQCASRYDQALDVHTQRQAINGWLHWQWAALAAFRCDPLLHGTQDAGHRAVCVAYGLEDSPAGLRVLDALSWQRRSAP